MDTSFSTENPDEVLYLLRPGCDGNVGANKNSIKIIGEDTDKLCPGVLVYVSMKSAASHLPPRFGSRPIHAPTW